MPDLGSGITMKSLLLNAERSATAQSGNNSP